MKTRLRMFEYFQWIAASKPYVVSFDIFDNNFSEQAKVYPKFPLSKV